MLSLILNKTLKGHCKTRWSCKKMAVMSLNLQIIYVYKILKEMSEDIKWNLDTKTGAEALLNQIDYSYYFHFQKFHFLHDSFLCR